MLISHTSGSQYINRLISDVSDFCLHVSVCTLKEKRLKLLTPKLVALTQGEKVKGRENEHNRRANCVSIVNCKPGMGTVCVLIQSLRFTSLFPFPRSRSITTIIHSSYTHLGDIQLTNPDSDTQWIWIRIKSAFYLRIRFGESCLNSASLATWRRRWVLTIISDLWKTSIATTAAIKQHLGCE